MLSRTDYHSLLEYLYFENYGNSYSEVEELLWENHDEDEIEEFCESIKKSGLVRPTKLPRSREADIGHDDWKNKPSEDWDRPEAAKKLRRRLQAVVGTRRREDEESGIREEVLDYLISENYASSYESAAEIYENMSDSWFYEAVQATRATTRGRRVQGSAQRAQAREDRRAAARERAQERKPSSADLEYVAARRKNPERLRREALRRTIADRMSRAAERLNVNEEYQDLTPEKEKRVKNRVGELARDIQVHHARMKELKKKPFGKYRPKIKAEAGAILKSARKKQRLVQNASDALIRTSTSRSAKIQKRIQDLKGES